jgi:putative aminopeptidase FrvX
MAKISLNDVDISGDLLAFAQELVRIQSYSGQEEAVARAIAAKMEALGYDEVRIDSCGSVLGRLWSTIPTNGTTRLSAARSRKGIYGAAVRWT